MHEGKSVLPPPVPGADGYGHVAEACRRVIGLEPESARAASNFCFAGIYAVDAVKHAAMIARKPAAITEMAEYRGRVL